MQCVQDVNMRAYDDTRYFGIKFQSDNGPSPHQAFHKWKFPDEKCTLYVSNHSAARVVGCCSLDKRNTVQSCSMFVSLEKSERFQNSHFSLFILTKTRSTRAAEKQQNTRKISGILKIYQILWNCLTVRYQCVSLRGRLFRSRFACIRTSLLLKSVGMNCKLNLCS